jgi:hypothetical protein
MEEWIEIVSDPNREEAARKFEIWKENNKSIWNELNEVDIRIDTIRTINKTCITRYCIKKDIMDRKKKS